MHNLSVKSNIIIDHSGSDRRNTIKGSSGENNIYYDQPLCPKPRRLGPPVPHELLKPLKCNKHSQSSTDSCRNGVLNMITEEKNIDGRELICCGCSPSCYAGSPPGRTDNPLVHDVKFIHQMELLSPFSSTKLAL